MGIGGGLQARDELLYCCSFNLMDIMNIYNKVDTEAEVLHKTKAKALRLARSILPQQLREHLHTGGHGCVGEPNFKVVKL